MKTYQGDEVEIDTSFMDDLTRYWQDNPVETVPLPQEDETKDNEDEKET